MTIFNFNNESFKSQLSRNVLQEKKSGFLLIESLFSLAALAFFAILFAAFYGNIVNQQKELITFMQAQLLAHSCAHTMRSEKKSITNAKHDNFIVKIEEEKIPSPKNFKLYRVIIQDKKTMQQLVSLLTGFRL